ncbi:hypothetical protein A7X95_07220 [Candidatus Nitrosopelagicus brevis]|uniref:Uncharacterized protein n=1 Tax=Candidatus Nitrosopelagicus brevis TaxID=1410606 RepID=A0A0A7V5W4_9ARCH|nr:hypothetical protein [Candidatus Nitrosopelagicus brevis]AJA92065.1 hypothetical protein T478_0436 [Candidatus Nitrosopelagicus brevis]PTL87646.1 hypothetical protein A7X95_07220 [Candidatus Nitrosopelagicus brevis]
MAMPMNNDEMDPDEGGAERTSNVTDYKRTCIDFIEDISGSYFEWIDYYSKNKQIDENEDKKRRTEISAVVEKTNTWLAKVPMTIKAVDVVMNDGIQKMAESTAGKPFQIGVFINKISEYTMAKPGIIDIHVKASGRDGRNVKLGSHAQDERFRIESTGKVFFDEENIPKNEFDTMDIHLKLNASKCVQRDVISFTVIVSEMKDGNEYDRRGLSTIIHIV